MRTVLLLAAALAAVPPSAADTGLHAGPMLAWATLREAAVWVQTAAPGIVEVRFAPAADPAAERAAPPVATTAAGDLIATVVLTGLEPGTRYVYRVLVDGAEATRPYPLELATQPLWQWRTDPPGFAAMIGSCAYFNEPAYDRPGRPYGSDEDIFVAMAAFRPDLMVWLGDNVYLREVDYGSAQGIRRRYRRDRGLPVLQPFLAATRHYATWDDHDFGPNDSDGSYTLKGASLDVFRSYWPGIAYGLPGVPGVFQRFTWNDVEFFLLDDRTWRDPDDWPEGPEKRMLGTAQMAWLERALVSSRATFKVVALGSQVLNPLTRFETLAHYAEYDELLAFIRRTRVGGVVFVSGDRHHSELIRVDVPGGYPLYDFTSSSLTAGIAPVEPGDAEFDNPFRVPGTLLNEHSFGVLRFAGPRTDRTLTFEAYGVDGTLRWSHTVRRRELSVPAIAE